MGQPALSSVGHGTLRGYDSTRMHRGAMPALRAPAKATSGVVGSGDHLDQSMTV